MISIEDTFLFVAITNEKMNKVKEEEMKKARKKGFRLASYISSRATIFNNVSTRERCFI